MKRLLAAVQRDRDLTARWIVACGIVAGTLVRVPQLFHSLAEVYAFRQAQTAVIVQQYAENGINLLITPLPVFGPNSNVPMEFPLFQAIASIGVSAGLPAVVASRLLGLLSFQAVAVLLFLLLRRWSGRRVAVLAVGLFEFLPFGLFWGAASLIDFFSVALALLMVWGLQHWFETGHRWPLVIGVLASWAAFLVKVTTAPTWGLLLLAVSAIIITRLGWAATWKRLLVGFAAGPGVGLLASIGWTVYADSIKAANPLTAFLTSSALRDWNFGTIVQRLTPNTWLHIGERVVFEMAVPVAVPLLLGIAALIFLRGNPRLALLGWMLTAISGPLVFTNLYYVHDYYFIAIYPAIVAIVAIGISWTISAVPNPQVRLVVVGLLVVGAIFSVVLSPAARADIAGLVKSAPLTPATIALRDHTEPGSLIVTVGCDWDPSLFFNAEREGVMFRGFSAGDFWQTESIDDYEYLYNCNPEFDSAAFLPTGTTMAPTQTPGLYELEN